MYGPVRTVLGEDGTRVVLGASYSIVAGLHEHFGNAVAAEKIESRTKRGFFRGALNMDS